MIAFKVISVMRGTASTSAARNAIKKEEDAMVTASRIAELEKHWLKAEAVADELKHEAARIRSSAAESDRSELAVLRAEELEARYAKAEQAASEAFDRLWQARDGGDAAVAETAEVRAA